LKRLIILFLLILVVQFRTPITLPGESDTVQILKINNWKWAYPFLGMPQKLVFLYCGQVVSIPKENIAAYWEEE